MKRFLSSQKSVFRRLAFSLGCLALLLCVRTEEAFAGPAKCFMHGIVTPQIQNKDKTNLSNMIRLKFDATEKKKCEQMLSAYCFYNVKGENFSPARLSASFKADIDRGEEAEYTFTEKCVLEEK